MTPKVYSQSGSPPWGPGVSLLKRHANGLLAVLKPTGVLAHPNRSGEQGRSLVRADFDLGQECYRWKEGGEDRFLHLLHRLDGPTSGVVLLAESFAVAEMVRSLFREQAVRKTYLAMVKGGHLPARSIWEDELRESRGQGRGVRVRTVSRGGLLAKTEVRLRERILGTPSALLLEMRPLTGRTHQLRVQAALRGLPVLGDRTYGDFGLNRVWARKQGEDRLWLHAWKVEVPLGRETFAAEAIPPKGFGNQPFGT